jgi:L-asparaginase
MEPSKSKFFVKTDFDDQVFIVGLFPGFTNEQIRKLFEDETIRGYILRTYGTGNVPNNKDFLDTIEKAVKEHKMVVNLSQCSVGTVEMGLYEASSGLMERGVLSGLDLTPEAAITKMMWILGTQYGKGKEYAQMQINQRGEQTDNLFDLRFGEIKKENAAPVFTSGTTPDGRLNRKKISDSMLRISNLGVKGVEIGKQVHVRAFMNMPLADLKTPDEEERHIATLDFIWTGKPETRMTKITYKTQNVIGEGDVILTLVSDSEKVKIYFSGLFIALYAKA